MWPIIHRELWVAMRDPAVRAMRLWVPVVGAAITALFLLVALADPEMGGQRLHGILVWALVAMGVVQGGRLATTAFAEDREQGTLPLLFLCGLKAHEVFAARVTGHAVVFYQALLSVAPFLVVPVFLGGVSADALAATWLVLPALLLLSMAIAVFAGLACREPSESTLLWWLLLLGSLGAGPGVYLVRDFLVGDGGFAGLAWLGPLKGMLALSARGSTFPWIGVGFSVGSTLVAALVFLAAAMWRLRRLWRLQMFSEVVQVPGRPGRGSRVSRPNMLAVDENPYAWRLLVEGGVRTRRTGWILVTGTAVAWLLALAMVGASWVSTGNALICGTVLVLLMSIWNSALAARGVAHDRRSRAFEHLLPTPLGVESILEGCSLAAVRHARHVRWVAAGLCVLWAILPVPWRGWDVWSATEYAALWSLLVIYVLGDSAQVSFGSVWQALNTGRSLGRPSFFALALLVFLLTRALAAPGGGMATGGGLPFPRGGSQEAGFVLPAVVMLGMLVFSKRFVTGFLEARRLLRKHFREIASAPLPERRFLMSLKWDGRRPLVPRGWTRRVNQTFSGTTNGFR
jgi:ABC-type transport system involved in cytochrome c biogenesis permease component